MSNLRPGDTVKVIKSSGNSALLAQPTAVVAYLLRLKDKSDLHFHWRFELVKASPTVNSADALKAVNIGGIHQKVLDCLRLFPGQEASSSEIEHATKLKAHKRMPELERLGKVVRAGKKKWEGRSVTIWRAAA